MSFSLRTLLTFVLLTAIFAAALIYRTAFWYFFSVNLGVVILLVATTGVFLQRLDRTFWIPFCIFGWFYYLSAVNVSSMSVLNRYSPGSQIAATVRALSVDAITRRHLAELLNMCLALAIGGLAGGVTSFLLKPKADKPPS
jgi:hypothetical protein